MATSPILSRRRSHHAEEFVERVVGVLGVGHLQLLHDLVSEPAVHLDVPLPARLEIARHSPGVRESVDGAHELRAQFQALRLLIDVQVHLGWMLPS